MLDPQNIIDVDSDEIELDQDMNFDTQVIPSEAELIGQNSIETSQMTSERMIIRAVTKKSIILDTNIQQPNLNKYEMPDQAHELSSLDSNY